MTKRKTWVRVNHVDKNITVFTNDGTAFTQRGAYMSEEYFQKLQEMMPEISNYEVINKIDPHSNGKAN